MRATVYLDNNATTPMLPEVAAAVVASLQDCYGNPSSKHHIGDKAREAVLRARSKVAALLSAAPSEIVLTSGATESNHLALLGSLARDSSRRHLIVSAVEHPSIRMLLPRLRQMGVRVTDIPVDGRGMPDLDVLRQALTEETALVSMMWVNNETGVVMPIAAVAALAADYGVPLHVDATQAVGRMPVDMRECSADLLSFSGHKFHAPKGVGGLFVRKGYALPALLAGHQERGRRGGTENVAALVGMGVAAELATQHMPTRVQVVSNLRDRFETLVTDRIGAAHVNGHGVARIGNTCNVSFPGLNAETIIHRLDQAGICVSSGAACAASGTEASHVLLAMGCSEDMARSAVRVSFGAGNTEEDAVLAAETLCDVVQPLLNRAA